MSACGRLGTVYCSLRQQSTYVAEEVEDAVAEENAEEADDGNTRRNIRRGT